jgi:hypothetical protein
MGFAALGECLCCVVLPLAETRQRFGKIPQTIFEMLAQKGWCLRRLSPK